jgi:aspartate/methionine/tyrosine aminotransferase
MENSTNSQQIHKKSKTADYEKPTIWYSFSRLAMTTSSVNLGQGFPDWTPPEFVLDAIQKQISNASSNHQYSRFLGSLKLCDSIARNYSDKFKRKIDPLSEILVANGAVSLLYNIITSHVEQGDEVIVIEPFYDCYLPQTELSGGKVIGIPMIPPKIREKSEYFNLINDGNANKIKDNWEIDFEKLEKAFSDKTKLLILNTPNNPTGKILSYEELKQIKNILDKYPKVVVVMDEVYEHMIYDEYEELPRMATLDGMWDRTVSILSAGKIYSCTGIRIGWCIGPKEIIRKTAAVYQFNSFCLYEPIQNAIADCLDISNQPYEGYDNYYKWLRAKYENNRHYLVESLAKNKNFDLNIWLPEGGYFVVADISTKNEESKYKLEGDENVDVNYSKDFNFVINTANEKKVVLIPCSPFYTRENATHGENFVRIAYCKKKDTLDKALANF